jgi:hypothetical protein
MRPKYLDAVRATFAEPGPARKEPSPMAVLLCRTVEPSACLNSLDCRDQWQTLANNAKLNIEQVQRRLANQTKKLREAEFGLQRAQDALEHIEANRQPGAPSIFAGRRRGATEQVEGRREALRTDSHDEQIAP